MILEPEGKKLLHIYNKKMKLSEMKKMIKEAAIGFRPDPTSKAQSQVKLIMSNLEQALEYFQNNAFVKSFDEDGLERLMHQSGEAMDYLNAFMQEIDSAPDSKKSKVGFSEEINEAEGNGIAKKIKDLLTSEGFKWQLATGMGAIIAGLAARPELVNKILTLFGLNEDMDLDRTWSDTFGKEKGDRLAKKQLDLINDPVLMKMRSQKGCRSGSRG